MSDNAQQHRQGGRPSWRPYQRGTYSRPAPPRQEEQDLPDLPLGPLINEYKTNAFAKNTAQYRSTARITDCSVVASWNWTTAQVSEMLIPGSPPRWSPPAQTERLPQDSGDYLRDRNAARCPAHPIEPVVLAAMNESPDVCGSNMVDVVACSSALGNLLRFVRGDEKPFRILVEKVGNTIFLIRRERSPTEKIIGVKGFGHTFPEAYTTWNQDVKSSSSHQRVLRYSLGGFRFLVRFEADGYIPDELDSIRRRAAQPVADKSFHSSTTALAAAFGSIGVAESLDTNTFGSELKIKRAGNNIPQHQVFDLKTRSEWKRKEDTLSQELPRLWLTQLHKFILAHHKDGVFNNVRIHKVRDRVLQWEQSNLGAISKFLSLISRIVDTAEKADGGKFEVCHMKDQLGMLQFRLQLSDAGSALSPETRGKWLAINENGEIDASDSDESSIEALIWDDTVTDYTVCSTVCGYCGQCTTVKPD